MNHRSVNDWLLALAMLLGMGAVAALQAPVSVRLALQVGTLWMAWRAATGSSARASPIGFYLPVSALYVLAAMLEVAVFGNRLELDAELMAQLADIGVLFLFSVAAGHEVVRQATSSHGPSTAPAAAPGTAAAALGVCAALLLIAVAMTLMRYGLGIGTISRADLYAEEFVLLSLVRGMLALSLGVSAALVVAEEKASGQRMPRERRTLLTVLALYALVDLLILGDRRLPVVAALSVGLVLAPRRVSATRIVGAAAAAAVLVLYGFVRNTPPAEWLSTIASGDILGGINPAANEFGGLAIIGSAIGDLSSTPADFPTYERAFLQVLPRSLLAARPESPTEWFIWSYFPALAEIGASFAFNAVIEALLNGGLGGVLAAGGATGGIIALVGRWQVQGAVIGVPVAAYVFTFSMRMDFASQLRTALVAAVGIFVLLVVARAVRSFAGPTTTPPTRLGVTA